MSELMILNLYKLCKSYDLHGLINKFGNLSDPIDKTNCIKDIFYPCINNSEHEDNFNPITYYAFYKAWYNTLLLPKDISKPILDWLLKLDPDLYPDNVIENYSADEIFSNDALFSACESGHYKVVKWLLKEEFYLSSFKNRCNIVKLFILSCNYKNLGIIKMIFNIFPECYKDRDDFINEAYKNAEKNKHKHIINWLIEKMNKSN
jgi:hypothetical protein